MWQALLQALGTALSFLYDLVPSYGIAIVLLTVAVRVVMLPLTIKQTRSMQEMGRLQPKIKELQRKHKGDRQKLNEEMMKLYKEHRVNPLGGCLPLVLQLPVFFALFSVLRATVPAVALPADPVSLPEEGRVFCTPVGEPSVRGTAPSSLECDTDGDGSFEERFNVGEWQEEGGATMESPPDIFTRCTPQRDGEDVRFRCESPVGSGQLPMDSRLFGDIIDDGEPFLGMYLSCGATQVQSEDAFRECAPRGAEAGGFPLLGYYGLIALMVGTTYYQTKQMQSASGGQQQQGAQAIGRVMPVVLGFISLSIPAGVLVYWVTTNLWQVGQQYVMLKQREAGAQQAASTQRGSAAKGQTDPKPKPPGRKSGGRDGRGRKKRRKR